VEIALRESFHRIDELLQDPQYSDLLQELRLQPNPSDKLHEPSNSNIFAKVLWFGMSYF